MMSQDLIFEHDINLKTSFEKNITVYPIFNKDSSKLSICILDSKYIYGILIDKEFNYEKRIIRIFPNINHDLLIGGLNSDNLYTLVFTNYDKNSFSSISFDYKNSNIRYDNINIDLYNETFLESFNANNKLYILTVKSGSTLKLYEFNSFYSFKENEFNISNKSFIDSESLFKSLIENQEATLSDNLIQKINNNIPNSINTTKYFNKLYYNSEEVVLTFDENDFNTTFISINLLDFTFKIENIHHDIPNCFKNNIKSNSFYYNGFLFLIDACPEELKFSIFNIEENKIINSYSADKLNPIMFKNTPLIQEGSAYVTDSYLINERLEKQTEINETGEFLRKMTNSQIGIVNYPHKNYYEITIGGTIKSQTIVLPSAQNPFSYLNGETKFPPNYLPSYRSLHSFDYSRTTYFKCIISKDSLNHIEQSSTENAYDKIKYFKNDNKNKVHAETIFKIDDYYLFGFWEKDPKKYKLYKFED